MGFILRIDMKGQEIADAVNNEDDVIINALSTKATVASFNAHVSNQAIHITIDDDSTSPTKTWSSSSLNTKINAKANSTHEHQYSDIKNADYKFLPKAHTHNLTDINNISGLFTEITDAEVSITPRSRDAYFSHLLVDMIITPVTGTTPPFVNGTFTLTYLCIGNNYVVNGSFVGNTITAEKPPKAWVGWVNGKCTASLTATIKNPFSSTEVTFTLGIVDIYRMNYTDIPLDDLVTELIRDPSSPTSFISVLVSRIQESLL